MLAIGCKFKIANIRKNKHVAKYFLSKSQPQHKQNLNAASPVAGHLLFSRCSVVVQSNTEQRLNN
ncbi:MAG: hypothetical protein IJQ14_03620, partial [Bacteroidales bacterium]|nr:hypothetical protein [Bacteroidales bacterium]